MFGLIDPLYAQQAAAPSASQSFMANFAPLLIVGVLFYFLFILMPKKREKKHQELVNS